MSQSLFYWITYSYNFGICLITEKIYVLSQSLFYWITYSYILHIEPYVTPCGGSQSLFYWITYSYIQGVLTICDELVFKSQSLFYWITYSYY